MLHEQPFHILVYVPDPRELKNDLGLRPVYHQLDDRIEAHIFTAFMALCLLQTRRKRQCSEDLQAKPQQTLGFCLRTWKVGLGLNSYAQLTIGTITRTVALPSKAPARKPRKRPSDETKKGPLFGGPPLSSIGFRSADDKCVVVAHPHFGIMPMPLMGRV